MSAITKLSAVILSDGDIDFKRYTVSFTESKEVVESIASEFNEINGIKIEWKVGKHNNSYRARAYSKNLVNLLKGFLKSFRTRPHGVHPFCSDKNCKNCVEKKIQYQEIRLPKMSKKEMAEFLRYYATCDGGPLFGLRKREDIGSLQIGYGIKIGCTNPSLRTQIAAMLLTFGIKTSIKSDGIEIRNIKSILIFQKNIGFLEVSKVRRGRIFNGYKKNNVVTLMVLCSLLTKQGHWLTRNFNSVEEAKKFLIGIISLIELNKYSEMNDFIERHTKFSLPSVDISPVSSVEWVPA